MLSMPARRALVSEGSALIRFNSRGIRTLATKGVAVLPSAYVRARLPNPSSTPRLVVTRAPFSTSRSNRQEQEDVEEEKKEMDDGEKNIHEILTKNFQPAHLQVQDVSGGCGSFYAIVIASTHFNGKPTVKAHRLVNEALKDVISGIHGLQLRTMPVKD